MSILAVNSNNMACSSCMGKPKQTHNTPHGFEGEKKNVVTDSVSISSAGMLASTQLPPSEVDYKLASNFLETGRVSTFQKEGSFTVPSENMPLLNKFKEELKGDNLTQERVRDIEIAISVINTRPHDKFSSESDIDDALKRDGSVFRNAMNMGAEDGRWDAMIDRNREALGLGPRSESVAIRQHPVVQFQQIKHDFISSKEQGIKGLYVVGGDVSMLMLEQQIEALKTQIWK